MKKLQNTIAQLDVKNFDILNNESLNLVQGGKSCGNGKSKKSRKSKKSKKSGNNYGCYNPCGW